MAANIPSTMRAIALTQFAKPAEYNISNNLPVPSINKPNEVLIKVHAASINPVDVKMAAPGIGGLMDTKAQFPYKLGFDLSGVIVATGSEPSNFKVGDEVFARVPGEYRGTIAEYASTPTTHVALKPKALSHVDAASIPLAGQTAFQVLRKADSMLPGGLKGKTVLIPAGLSGTGSFGVQIAKNYFQVGKVVTTLSPGKIRLAEEVLPQGVIDQAVDYTKGTPYVIEQVGKGTVDFLFDTAGQTVALAPTVKKGGIILSISTMPDGSVMRKLQPSMVWWLSYFLDIVNWGMTKYVEGRWGVQYSYFLLDANGKDLATLGDLAEKGLVKPIVGEVAELDNVEDVRSGCGKVMEGKGGIGKFVIEVAKA